MVDKKIITAVKIRGESNLLRIFLPLFYINNQNNNELAIGFLVKVFEDFPCFQSGLVRQSAFEFSGLARVGNARHIVDMYAVLW